MTNSIGERIKAIRKSKLMSMTDVAKAAKMHIATISKIESGDTPAPLEKTLAKIAKALGMEPEEFSKAIHYVEMDEEKKDGKGTPS